MAVKTSAAERAFRIDGIAESLWEALWERERPEALRQILERAALAGDLPEQELSPEAAAALADLQDTFEPQRHPKFEPTQEVFIKRALPAPGVATVDSRYLDTDGRWCYLLKWGDAQEEDFEEHEIQPKQGED